ncbi:phosphate ABC transporter permeae PstC [Streptococcus pneumoniae]|nr:phosphate ABC transporter, permease protein PstC [Streptococcus pneumoniae SP11-BS70]CEX99449.1 phosphate ABC transporter permeae PstC [Streptococcus pneumoniae]CGF63906.1 phosphate ABC transporter permeae PstC [Streptococcus pneumoniae]CIW09157.1 phosphate ABC transporter permeae PstC [Streptococcus pneumoniae]CIW19899.1 phosphate ABC transporter permeae PstC [Streptococcus pneumoniae]
MALGASHERSIFSVILPAARSGILSAVILGIGRAVGETMAVILVAGNQPIIPSGLFSGTRTLTTNIVLEMAYASGQHREALIATSAVLFFLILLINAYFAYLKGKSSYE